MLISVATFKKAGLYEKISVIEPADPFVITPVN